MIIFFRRSRKSWLHTPNVLFHLFASLETASEVEDTRESVRTYNDSYE